MKKKRKILFPYGDEMRLQFRKMKLTVVLLFIVFVTFGNSFSQVRLSVHFNKTDIRDVLEIIEEKTDYIFLYKDNIFDFSKKVSGDFNDVKFEDVLNSFCDQTNISYEIRDRQIILKEKGVTPLQNEQQPQKKEITGTVKDSKGLSVPGVNVTVKGTTIGTITDSDGNFKLSVPADAKIVVFSFVGMKSQEFQIAGKATYKVVLADEAVGMDEIVIVAFGTQKKATVTGSIASIQTAEIKQSPSANLAITLAGRLPGLTAIQRTGEPGRELVQLYIRGIGTVNAQSPIILVDGVERELTFIDPNEVASITILKDASSTAIFGVRGANGVILVTTKRGTSEIPEINFSSEFSAQDFTRDFSSVNAFQYASLRNLAQRNDGLGYAYSAEAVEKYRTGVDPLRYPNTNWKDILLKDYSFQQRYNLNISGAGKTVKYFVNAGYLNQGSQFKTEDNLSYDPSFKLDRYNFRSNIDIQLNKSLKAFLNVAGYLEKQNSPLGVFTELNPATINTDSPSLWIMAYMYDNPATIPGPVVPPGYGEASGQVTTSSTNAWPSYGQMNRAGYIQQNKTNVTATYGMEQALDFVTEGLSAKAVVSFDTRAINNLFAGKTFPKYVQVIDPNLKGTDGQDSLYYRPLDNLKNTPLSISGDRAYSTLSIFQGYVNYNRVFSKHAVTGLLLYQQQKNISNIELPFNLRGFATRLTYGFDERYLAEFNAGYNGSEQFAKGHRFGFFPAVSAGWVVSKEKFFTIRHIDLLKIRGSYGKVGNDRMGGNRFLYLDDIQIAGGGFSGSLGNGLRVNTNRLRNESLQWEVAKKANIGMEIGFLSSFNLIVDVFNERRDNILRTRGTIPALNGLPISALPPVNIGIVENKGYEIELNYKKAFTKDFSLLSKINLNYAKNKQLFADEPLLPEDYAYRYRQTGYPIGQPFGYIVDRYFTDEADINKSPVQTVGGHESRPGDFKYKDLNGDGFVNEKDMAPIGYSTVPEYIFGGAININFKNFDFSILFQGVKNVNNFYQSRNTFAQRNYVSRHLDSWTAERAANGDPISYPRLTTQQSPNEINNTFFNVDASYLRLKNMEFGYTIPQRISEKIGSNHIRLYASGINLVTWDRLPTKDFDPEISDYVAQGFSFPVTRLYNVGVNVTF